MIALALQTGFRIWPLTVRDVRGRVVTPRDALGSDGTHVPMYVQPPRCADRD